MWEPHLKNYKAYLQLEKSLSDNSVQAYLHDVEMLVQYLQTTGNSGSPAQVTLEHLQQFIRYVGELGMTPVPRRVSFRVYVPL
jgi:Site-specific recombinase XerD